MIYTYKTVLVLIVKQYHTSIVLLEVICEMLCIFDKNCALLDNK